MNWDDLRSEFPVTEKWSFLDHAGIAPPPRRSANVLREYADDLSWNGSACVGSWVARAKAAREIIAKYLGGDPAGIALTKNTTEAISFVAEGFPWQPGDNVVLPADEFPANQYPWLNLESRGVSVRRIEPRGNRIELKDLEAACDRRTRVLAISHVGYASGFRVNLADLVTLTRSRDIFLLVDAIQGLGALGIDLEQTPIDFMSCGSSKWLLGPQGAGFLYVRPGLIDRLRTVEVGAASVLAGMDYSRIELDLKPDASRWECGTLNFGGIAALAESIEMLAGLPAVSERIHELTTLICDRVRRAGFKVFSSRESDEWSGIVSIDMGNRDVAALARRCKEAGVMLNNRGGRLRVSPHVYNNEDDIDRLMDVITKPE